MSHRAALLVALLALGACRSAPVEPPYIDAALMQSEGRAAIGRPGTSVCRELKVGTVEQDWVRGTVVSANDERLQVRIDDPGRFTHLMDGVMLARDAVVLSDPMAWVPCR